MEAVEVKPSPIEESGFLAGDPYKELEMYLDKVNEEIGEVFDKWKTKDPGISTNKISNGTVSSTFRFKFNSDSDVTLAKIRNGNFVKISSHENIINGSQFNECAENRICEVEDCTDSAIVTVKERNFKTYQPTVNNDDKGRDDFSERFLAEFNEIVAKRLLDLSLSESVDMPNFNLEVDESDSDHDYDDVFNSEEEESLKRYSNSRDSRSKSLEDATFTCPKESPADQRSNYGFLNYKISPSKAILANFLSKQNRHSQSLTLPSPGDAVLTKVISIPDRDFIGPNISERRSTEPTLPKHLLISNAEPLLTKRKLLISKSLNNSPKLLPKNKNHDYNTWNNKVNGNCTAKSHNEVNKSSKSKPVVKPKPDHLNMRKQYSEPDIMVSKSPSHTVPYKTGRDLGRLVNINIEKIRAGLMLQNVPQNQVENKTFDDRVNNNASNKFNSFHDFDYRTKENGKHSSTVQETIQHWNKLCSQSGSKDYLGMEDRSTNTISEECPESAPSTQINLQEGGFLKDAETQTHETPSLSRSSSCTWASECSSSIFNTGSTNASVSDEEAAAVDDDIRSSSSSGGELAVAAGGDSGGIGAGEESGIGTASPPLRQRKDNEKGQSGLNKCKRKETWERLRRRQSNTSRQVPFYRMSTVNDVWVRRESVTTQTVSPEDLEHLQSDNTCNTEDTSSNENLLIEDSFNDTSLSENSLRRNLLYRRYNEINQSSSGIGSSANMADETDDASLVDSSGISIPSSNSTFKTAKPIRPTYLKLNITRTVAIPAADSPTSSGDCLDDSRSFQDFLHLEGREQPSPSTASLKMSIAPMPNDLGNKCSSVPVLMRKRHDGGMLRREGSEDSKMIPQRTRAQSEKHIAEIEAAEACKWLRAAGFPQYAQMYEDMQFPINVSGVQSDHPFLDPDSLQSLFRRLTALNKCADMKLEHTHQQKHTHEESDEENQCALSENWQYERKSRRWSRVVDITPQAQQRLQALADKAIAEQNARDRAENPPDLLTVPGQELASGDGSEEQGSRFRRTGSERLRDGAKAFLRRVESMKSKKRKRQNREGVVISSPQVFDVLTMEQKMKDLNCIDISPTANISYIDFPSPTNYPSSPLRSQPPSPMSTMPPSPMTSTAPSFAGQIKLSPAPFGDDSSSYCSDGSQTSAHRNSTKSKLGHRAKKLLHRNVRQDDPGALSDSECQPSSWRHHYFKDANSNNTKVVLVEPPSPPEVPRVSTQLPSPPTSPKPRGRSRSPAHRPAIRAGSLNLGKDRYRDRSFKREKSASRSELSGSQESGGSHQLQDETDDKVNAEVPTKTKGNVQRWHSFQRSSSLGSRPSSNVIIPQASVQHEGEDLGAHVPMAAMSCGQLQVLRKLALLKLTACMERYCPTHRTGWNWELPKFIRKIKAPDYKDKTVFGVPLLVTLQRTGHALPKPIQTALRWLRNNALDQVGIFRKAGVRSRTFRLRQLAESAGASSIGNGGSTPPPPPATLAPYDEQQAHDVADMVKQYFRELPDALLTNKLSETFIAIFQHVPAPMREDAVQCALLLLPEEHREALQVVLAFLQQVADHSATNQMTASNLAVCLAPTLLRLHHNPQSQGNSNKEGNSNRSASASPRRRRGGGTGGIGVAAPDPKELNESRAAHDCLLLLIKRHRELFTVSVDTLQRCNFNSLEESIPVTLEELGSELEQDWQGFQQASTQALLKEAREKSRGWVSVTTHEPHVELCYRKVGDGHPLRLWRVTTEVEAPPTEVLNRILRERHIWDDSLLKWRVVERLNSQAEVFQYLTASMAPLQAKDYCVLRSWQSDLPRGGCCVVETSVSHAGAPILLGGVRAVVLASRYLIEPAGKGRSRLMHLARVDTKGRTPEWYNKSYGHICAQYSARIRASFKHNTDGPESNV